MLRYSILKTKGMGHVQQAMLQCTAGYATMYSRLCYLVQQAMLSFNPIIMPLRGPT